MVLSKSNRNLLQAQIIILEDDPPSCRNKSGRLEPNGITAFVEPSDCLKASWILSLEKYNDGHGSCKSHAFNGGDESRPNLNHGNLEEDCSRGWASSQK